MKLNKKPTILTRKYREGAHCAYNWVLDKYKNISKNQIWQRTQVVDLVQAIFLLIILNLLCFSCRMEKASMPEIASKAIIYNNNLPVDGCAEHIYLEEPEGKDSYAVLPDSSSRSLFYNILDTEIAQLPQDIYHGNLQIPVVIKYQKTSNNAELLCGWGKSNTVPQIKIVSITKR